MSATPATQNDGRCERVPRLPRETKVDVRLCRRLPRKMARRHRAPKPDPSAPPSAMSATPATRNDGRCECVPRLPRETTVDVRLCHACHARWRGAQTRPKRATESHECHASLGSGLAPGDAAPSCVAGVAQPHIYRRFTWQAWHTLASTVVSRGRRGTHGTGWRPRKTTVDASVCHACHVKRRWM